MLYTIIPLEQIYKGQKERTETIERKEIAVENGVLSLRKETDHYVVDKLWSTDMNDYLKDEYMPGSKRDL